MPRSSSGRQPDGNSRERDGKAFAIEVLSKLKPPVRVDATTAKDEEALAEIVCDHFERLDRPKLLQALAGLLLPLSDRLADDQIVREYYMLRTNVVSEDAIAGIYRDLLAGRRIRPIAEWVRQSVDRSMRSCVGDPKATLQTAQPGSSDKEWTEHKVCMIVNVMPYAFRRVAWLMFVAKKSYREIAAEIDAPLERIEMLIAQLVAQAYRANVEDPRSSQDAARRMREEREKRKRTDTGRNKGDERTAEGDEELRW